MVHGYPARRVLPAFDLQAHSDRSDGALAPAEVVAAAARAGVELLALTDHDTVDGVGEALAAGRREGVEVVPAAELSAVHEAQEDLHVLGYRLDHRDATLRERLDGWREDRARRVERMGKRLRELGWELDTTALDKRRAAGLPLGRPHLAAAAHDHPANAGRIADERLGSSSELLVAYLIPGRPAYLPRTRPTVPDAIAAVHDAGGVAVWAHPFWDVDATEEVLRAIDGFCAVGLDGVEVFYPTHDCEHVALLADHCASRGLLQTGSADFHGPDHPDFSRFRAFELCGREPVLGRIAAGK
jgi:3',5'-nucleoside bisphosphate phosphatase